MKNCKKVQKMKQGYYLTTCKSNLCQYIPTYESVDIRLKNKTSLSRNYILNYFLRDKTMTPFINEYYKYNNLVNLSQFAKSID